MFHLHAKIGFHIDFLGPANCSGNCPATEPNIKPLDGSRYLSGELDVADCFLAASVEQELWTLDSVVARDRTATSLVFFNQTNLLTAAPL